MTKPPKEASAQGKGRMAVAQKEQAAARQKKIDAYQMSGYTNTKYRDSKTNMFTNSDGANGIAPAQYGNPNPSARNAARNKAFASGKPLAKKGK